jgi:hypothetical protein
LIREQGMAKSVYIETSIVSYLTAWRSRDIIRSAQQQITREWWDVHRSSFRLYASQIVRLEAAAGDAKAAEDRMKVLSRLPLLEITETSLVIARALLKAAALPAVARRDAEHVGVAASNGMDYLLTWNCRHLANVAQRDKIEEVCAEFDYRAPKICTPEELFGDSHG